jgi:hypothetical protein
MMLQIIDLENNELFNEISTEESASISGGATPNTPRVATNMLPLFGVMALLPLALMFATTGMLGDIGGYLGSMGESMGDMENSTATS